MTEPTYTREDLARAHAALLEVAPDEDQLPIGDLT